jgi:hypothetical protein
MTPIFFNNATSTLNGVLAFNATELSIQTADAAKFTPAPAAGEYFMLTIQDMTVTPNAIEIVQVTAVNGNLFTIVRGQEGTAAQSFNNTPTTVSARLTAGTLALLVANGGISTEPKYIGAYANPPTTMPDGTTLLTGTLYFNTTSDTLFEWSMAGTWVAVSTQGSEGGSALYLGEFATAPTEQNDGSPLVIGNLYWNTTSTTLYSYSGSVWDAVVNVNYIDGDVTIAGDLLVTGNLTVQGSISLSGTLTVPSLVVTGTTDLQGGTSIEGTLTLDGLPVVAADQLSGAQGVQNFPDGTVMQWGIASFDSQVTFDPPYTTHLDCITITPIGQDGLNQGVCEVNNGDLTGFVPTFVLSGGGLATTQCYWIALGK